jgi:membrane fusion protein (multidrug efflux system)
MSVTHHLRAAVGLSLLLFLPACDKGQKKESAPPPPAVVKVSEAITRDVPSYSEAVGQTIGNKEIEISARVEGFLETMTFKEGTFVKKGQVLYTIDSRPFRAALAQAQADLAKSEAELVRAQQDVARYAPLVAKNAVSVQEYETAVANERAQKSAVAASRASADRSRIELGYTTVVAPDDGLIGVSQFHPGTLVGRAGSTQLTQLSKIDPIHVRFSISEREYLTYARRRAEKGLPPAAAATDDAGAAQATEFQLVLADGSVHPYEGSLVFVDRNVDARTGTIRLEAAFPNPKDIVRPGQYARVRAATNLRKDAVVVPQGAVQELQGIFNVAVVKPDNSFEVRPVTTAERSGNLIVIESGLKAGERIVVEGMQKLRPGTKVKPELVPIEEAPVPPTVSAPAPAPLPAASGAKPAASVARP